MIHSVGSFDPRFRELSFAPGLNVVVADRHDQATDSDTRNGVGKSSLVAVLHFLLGGNVSTGSVFKSEALRSHRFSMVVDVGGLARTIERGTVDARKITVSPLSAEARYGRVEQISSLFDLVSVATLSPRQEQEWLRAQWYALTEDRGPSSRALLSYAMRRVENGGFADAFKHSYQQTPGESQIAVSYLLDLDWQLAESWQDVRKREKSVKALAAALKEGRLGSFTAASVAHLRTELALAESDVDRLREAVDSFRVIDAFSELETEANEISGQIRRIGEDNAIDRALVDQLQVTYESEIVPSTSELAAMYDAAGVQLGELVVRRFDEVAAFHESIVANRTRHLQDEIDRATERIAARADERERLESRRTELLRVLQSGGALSALTGLQEELGRRQGAVEELRNNYRVADEIASGQAGVRRTRQNLLLELQDDQRGREVQLRALIARFEELSSRLYDERVASLEIGYSENGPTFSVSVEAGRSKGISNMQIFCFDLLVAELLASRGSGPGFLVHDSHLFDGVDERQIARGLALGAEVAATAGFQYIVTINSDDLPSEYPAGFDIERYVSDVRLTDAVDEGGLFGFRF